MIPCGHHVIREKPREKPIKAKAFEKNTTRRRKLGTVPTHLAMGIEELDSHNASALMLWMFHESQRFREGICKKARIRVEEQ